MHQANMSITSSQLEFNQVQVHVCACEYASVCKANMIIKTFFKCETKTSNRSVAVLHHHNCILCLCTFDAIVNHTVTNKQQSVSICVCIAQAGILYIFNHRLLLSFNQNELNSMKIIAFCLDQIKMCLKLDYFWDLGPILFSRLKMIFMLTTYPMSANVKLNNLRASVVTFVVSCISPSSDKHMRNGVLIFILRHIHLYKFNWNYSNFSISTKQTKTIIWTY